MQGEGKGKGRAQPKAAPTSTFEGYCHSCGEWGHRSADWWGPKEGKGAASTQPKAGKGNGKGTPKASRNGEGRRPLVCRRRMQVSPTLARSYFMPPDHDCPTVGKSRSGPGTTTTRAAPPPPPSVRRCHRGVLQAQRPVAASWPLAMSPEQMID